MIAATKGFVRKAGLVLAVSLPLISTQAHAQTATVTVGGIAYELSAVFTSYNNASTQLLQGQVWWGKASLALDFATALAATGIPWSPKSAYFAYSAPASVGDQFSAAYTFNFASPAVAGDSTWNASSERNFVTATASASSVPEINAGSLSQALLILFALWLVTWRRPASRVA